MSGTLEHSARELKLDVRLVSVENLSQSPTTMSGRIANAGVWAVA
jgi:hypothetical protein